MLARRTHELLRRRGAELGPPAYGESDLLVEDRSLGAGYGHRTVESERAPSLTRELESLELEPVYTAKAVAALLDWRERGVFGKEPVLYWHTQERP